MDVSCVGLGEPQLPNEQDAYLLAGGIVGGCISPYNFFLYSSLVINKPLPSTTRGEKSILLKYIGLEVCYIAEKREIMTLTMD
jgi:Mn2+/Fe2+ NRAMP family transporter